MGKDKLTCIVCPVGCSLKAKGKGDDLTVTGNRCPRGLVYARQEILAPRRTVTAACKIAGAAESVRCVPVKTSTPCLREKIPALLQDIYKLNVKLPVKTGDVLIADWNGEGIDIIVTRTIPYVA